MNYNTRSPTHPSPKPAPGGAFFVPAADLSRPGRRLLLCTDGVTEAQNPARFLFGERRLLDAVRSAPDSPQAALDALLAAIGAFAPTALQADDIPLLAVTYDGWRRGRRVSSSCPRVPPYPWVREEVARRSARERKSPVSV